MDKKSKAEKLVSILILMGALSLFVIAARWTVAAEGPVHRVKTVVVEYTEYHWWLVRWKDNKKICDLYVDHKGRPTHNDVYYQCDRDAYRKWLNTTSCSEVEAGNESKCSGYYFQFITTNLREKEVVIQLPEPKVTIDISGCEYIGDSDFCQEIPELHFTATDPLPNETIVQIQGRLNDIPFVCQGNECQIPLRPTGKKGVTIEFWADSSFGDSSQHYRGRVRVSDSGILDAEGTSGWHVDLMSEQYANGENIIGCASSWEAFPPIGDPPAWLGNPRQVELLETDAPYTFLAGQLIQKGYVDASPCPHDGLLYTGYASPCGLKIARVQVHQWQNYIDPIIMRASQKSGIPSQLLKRIFAQESQFWPGTLDFHYPEYGWGQLTELGADTTLLWNQAFFQEFCPLVLSENTCQRGYPLLKDRQQEILRGAFLNQVEVDLPPEREELDPEGAETSVDLFTESILGNCRQVGNIIEQETDRIPGEVSSYEDLWRYTLVNYHAGPGCLSNAIQAVNGAGKPLAWQDVSSALMVSCPNAVEYVEKVTQQGREP